MPDNVYEADGEVPAGQGRWAYRCPAGDFSSVGHPDRASAEARGAEHEAEHLAAEAPEEDS